MQFVLFEQGPRRGWGLADTSQTRALLLLV